MARQGEDQPAHGAQPLDVAPAQHGELIHFGKFLPWRGGVPDEEQEHTAA
ncbi:hypothetical protein [Streptomyces chartreusis]